MTGYGGSGRAAQVAVVALGLVSGVVAGENRYRVPDKGYLAERIEQLYRAEVGDDWKTFYSMTSPELRGQMTLEQFMKEGRGRRPFKVASYRIRRIRGAEKDEDAPQEVDGAAEVVMDVFVEYPGGRREKQDDQTDYWVHIKGEWYWTWRGWPAD